MWTVQQITTFSHMWKHPVDSEGHTFTAGSSVAIYQNLGKTTFLQKTRRTLQVLLDFNIYPCSSFSLHSLHPWHLFCDLTETPWLLGPSNLSPSWYNRITTSPSPRFLLDRMEHSFLHSCGRYNIYLFVLLPSVSPTTIFLHSSLRQPSATEGHYTSLSLVPRRTRFPASPGPLALPLLPGHIRPETLPTRSRGRALTYITANNFQINKTLK